MSDAVYLLPAPPGAFEDHRRPCAGAGQADHRRLGLPIMYSSATMSPITKTRFPANLSIIVCSCFTAIGKSTAIASLVLPSPEEDTDHKSWYRQHAFPSPGL